MLIGFSHRFRGRVSREAGVSPSTQHFMVVQLEEKGQVLSYVMVLDVLF